MATFKPAPVVTQAKLKAALASARAQANGGFNLDMWATVVDREGVVVAVAFSGATEDAQWPGSRVISAQKANTANAFSLVGLSLSTANLYSAVQPGQSLFGLQESNPVDTGVAYGGSTESYGTTRDFMVGKKIGGVNVFGGGLALYDHAGKIVGGLGVSGDSACADHNIAWRTRDLLKLDFVPGGVAPDGTDNIIYDITGEASAGGFGHPECSAAATLIGEALPTSNPLAG
ncbi:MAG: heme-binding protein [Deltaproteobacteria bacterium]